MKFVLVTCLALHALLLWERISAIELPKNIFDGNANKGRQLSQLNNQQNVFQSKERNKFVTSNSTDGVGGAGVYQEGNTIKLKSPSSSSSTLDTNLVMKPSQTRHNEQNSDILVHSIDHADSEPDVKQQTLDQPNLRELQQQPRQPQSLSHGQSLSPVNHNPQIDKNGRVVTTGHHNPSIQHVPATPHQHQTLPQPHHQTPTQTAPEAKPIEVKPIVPHVLNPIHTHISQVVPSGPANSSVYSHLQHYFSLNILPVVFINYGTQQDMMKYCIEVSSRLNPVIVLSDTFSEQQAMDLTQASLSGNNQPVFYIAFNDFLNVELKEFNKIYRPFQLQRDNPKRQMYEQQCITRWLVLNQLAKVHRIPTLFYVDSDVAVFGNITTAYHIRHNHLRHCDVMMSAAGGQAPRGDNKIGTFAGHSSFWSAASLVDLSRFFFELYSPEFINVLHYPNPPRDRQRISDMSLLYLYFIIHNRNATTAMDTGTPNWQFNHFLDNWKWLWMKKQDLINQKTYYDDTFKRMRDEFKLPVPSDPSIQVCNVLDIYAQTTFCHMHYFNNPGFGLNLDVTEIKDLSTLRPDLVEPNGVTDSLSHFLPYQSSTQRVNLYGGWTEMFMEETIERFDKADLARQDHKWRSAQNATTTGGHELSSGLNTNSGSYVRVAMNRTNTISTSSIASALHIIDGNSTPRRLQAVTTNTTVTSILTKSSLSVLPFTAPDDRIYFYSGHYQGSTKHYIQFDICRRLVSVSQFQMERAALSVQFQALHVKHHHKHHASDGVKPVRRLRRRRLDGQANTTTNSTTITIPTPLHLTAPEHFFRHQRIAADHAAFEFTSKSADQSGVVYNFMLSRIMDSGVQTRCREIFDKKEEFPKYSTRRLSRDVWYDEEEEEEDDIGVIM